MNLPSLEIPENPDELAEWLEGQLLGDQLRALVAELLAIHASEDDHASLEDVIGESRLTLLHRGLQALPDEQLLRLLQRPRLLLELQECVLVEGGPYWQQKIARGTFGRQLNDKNWQHLEQSLRPKPRPTVRPKGPWSQRPVWMALATAAAVLVAVFVGRRLIDPAVQPSISSWGWNSNHATAAEMPAPDYLRHLAGQAREWFNKRPVDQAALAERIAQFRAGCTHLITSEHPQLNDEDQQWLRERCQAWAGDIDTHLALAESAPDANTVLQARAAMDATVTKLANALDSRARVIQ